MWKIIHLVSGAWIQTHNLLNTSLLPYLDHGSWFSHKQFLFAIYLRDGLT